MSIRYNKNLNQRLRKAVNDFNKRVEQANAKAGREILSKRSVEELKSRFFKRTELERELRHMEKIKRRGMTKTVTLGEVEMTKWEAEELKAGLTFAKIQRTKIHKKVAEKEDKPDHYGMHSDRYDQTKVNREALNRYKDLSTLSFESYERLKRAIASETNKSYYNKLFYDEFFSRLIQVEDIANVDPLLVKKVRNLVDGLDPDDFLEIYNQSPHMKIMFEYIETKGFRKEATGYRGKKSRINVREETFNGAMNNLLQELPTYIKKYAG